MKFPKFVCPSDETLLRSFEGRTVAVRVNDAAHIDDAAAKVRASGNELHCVILDSDLPLSRIGFPGRPITTPVAIMAPALGAFRELAKHIDVLRSSNIRVYLPGNTAENLSGLRILSSLGIPGFVRLNKPPIDWEALSDLMTYALLGRVPHAPIEPFAFIAANYEPHSNLSWGSLEFDDPEQVLHLDENGQVALTADHLRRGIFVAQQIGEIGLPSVSAAIRKWSNAWRAYFVENHPCAACRAWKVCLGRFSHDRPDDRACAMFFTELMEIARARRSASQPSGEGGIWPL